MNEELRAELLAQYIELGVDEESAAAVVDEMMAYLPEAPVVEADEEVFK